MDEQAIFGIHATALRLRAQRAGVIATNLANINTPGYKARDMDFSKVFQGVSSSYTGLQTTNSKHISHLNSAVSGHQLKYRVPLQDSVDGNSVDMHLERSQFTQNALMYQTSLRFLNGRVQGLLSAIRGE